MLDVAFIRTAEPLTPRQALPECIASINDEDGACDEGAGVAGEQECDGCDLVRGRVALHGNFIAPITTVIVVFPVGDFRLHVARRDSVDAYSLACPFGGEGFCQVMNRRFRDAVRRVPLRAIDN